MNFKNMIMTLKFYIQRSNSYLSIINACMILIVMLKSFNLDVSKYVPILIVVGVTCLIFVGYMDNKLGFYSAEVMAINKRNPVQNKMFKRFDELEERLKRIEDRL